jgi:hypothetical protein
MPDSMRILVVSTPKTGNTWVKNLLASVYGLPIREVSQTFNEDECAAFGPRWISQQHFYPTARLMKWARAHDVVFVTTIRHPADVLVSLFHYTADYGADDELLNAIRADNGTYGPSVTSYVRDAFFLLLNQSIAWMRADCSHVVRYEELWHDPPRVLSNLARQIRPVSSEMVERAVERCDIDLMRKGAIGQAKRFFRKGGAGGWRSVLPSDIVDLLRASDPYPSQFEALGYSVDADTFAEVSAARRQNPIAQASHFDNGVKLSPVIVDLFLSLPREIASRWQDPTATPLADSFFHWMQAASAKTSDHPPRISNLAMHLYEMRPDVREKFPDLNGPARNGFHRWFVTEAAADYGLDPRLLGAPEDTQLAIRLESRPMDTLAQ